MIFTPFERMVAMRYLRARRQEGFISVISWFSLIGIALGVGTLIVVMSVMNGFQVELFQRVLGLNGHFNVYSMDRAPLHGYQPMLDQLQKLPGVINASPTIEGQALVTHEGVASGVFVRGVTPEAFRHRQTVAEHIFAGSLDDFGDESIAIGVRMAERLNLQVGDTLTLISPVTKSTPFGTAPRLRGYKIAAVFDVGMQEYDNNYVFMPLEDAQAFFSMGDGVTSLEIFVKDPQNLSGMRQDIAAAANYPGSPRMRLLTWKESNGYFISALEVEKSVMFLILSMMVIVAAFNIISGLIMLVKDKGSAIAIMRTMGATRGMVMRIFFLNGASIGLAGTILGVLLGLLFAGHIEQIRQALQYIFHTTLFPAEIYFLTHMPSVVDPYEVVRVTLMSLGFSFLATLYPSWRAARLDPVEALRYE